MDSCSKQIPQLEGAADVDNFHLVAGTLLEVAAQMSLYLDLFPVGGHYDSEASTLQPSHLHRTWNEVYVCILTATATTSISSCFTHASQSKLQCLTSPYSCPDNCSYRLL
jgi:hypothetical protein